MYNLHEQDAKVEEASTSTDWLGPSLEEWGGFARQADQHAAVKAVKIHAYWFAPQQLSGANARM